LELHAERLRCSRQCSRWHSIRHNAASLHDHEAAYIRSRQIQRMQHRYHRSAARRKRRQQPHDLVRGGRIEVRHRLV